MNIHYNPSPLPLPSCEMKKAPQREVIMMTLKMGSPFGMICNPNVREFEMGFLFTETAAYYPQKENAKTPSLQSTSPI